jgi:hypothetical protein
MRTLTILAVVWAGLAIASAQTADPLKATISNLGTEPAPYIPPAPQLPTPLTPFGSPQLRSADSQHTKLGNLNSNPYDPDSVANPYGQYGSPYSPNSVNNPYGVYGSPYSPYSATNPYATQAPAIVTPNGKYLGRFSANPYDPDSTSNPYGQYGSPYSPNSINNPYGAYGSPYSPSSAGNRFSIGTSAPSLPVMPTVPIVPAMPRLPALPTLPSLPFPKY